jgi:chromosome segregation protein
MRLTQLKLAGFKSFVDPTAIQVPGQLVGVVGPNGCGKSNIIDAVRWVLGESRASALRGDSMQDVIFNGSSRREPVARASVELCFDNSLGKAAGAWSQYAEISVKRVLQRDGESSYFINNTHVRRRDVQDIFLGTGLGPRAYAIIEQGMISRIIEAKPEDVRVFLEEAAGISKYKERRRETEHRLADTRENLSRVNDIRQELETQIGKLEGQAEIARRFQELSAERQQKQNLLALLRRNDAQAEAQRQARDIEKTGLELEAETARLRELERELEQTRSAHYAAADAMNAAQGELYQSNAAVASLESEIRFVTETRQRIEAQLAQGRAQREAGERQSRELEEADGEWRARLDDAQRRLALARERRAEESSRLPQAETAHGAAQEQLEALRARLTEAERALHLEQVHASHAAKNLQNLEGREQRLLDEQALLAAPDAEMAARLEQDLQQNEAELSRQHALMEQLETSLTRLGAERSEKQQSLQGLERELSGLNAKLLTLQEIQKRADENRSIDDWLARHGLASAPRLWQRINVEPGWETAVESVLRERLHALEVSDPQALHTLAQDPPAARAIAYTGDDSGMPERAPEQGAARSLASLVACQDARFAALVQAWLGNCFAVEGVPGLDERLALDSRSILVNREGHQFSRYGVSFHAPDPADTGLFARRREIESLESEVGINRGRIDDARAALETVSSQLEEHTAALGTVRAAGTALKQRHHELELEQVRRNEERERYVRRSSQIAEELAEIGGLKEAERAGSVAAEDNCARLTADLERLRDEQAALGAAFATAQEALKAQRESLQRADREEQDAGYSERDCNGKLADIASSLQKLGDQLAQAAQSVAALEEELAGQQDQGLREQLQEALELRTGRERALAQARSSQDELTERLRAGDESRLAVEQKLQPLRDRIAELRLKEQAARLNFEQYAAQLAEAGADEDALLATVKEGQKAAPLQAEITRLVNAITELGAINMAALEELSTSRERKAYLDAQGTDLSEALEILDNAIRRIDRETRELLQTTFTAVNGHFGQMFPALFGGGEARLEITGEEVLDAGVQIIARPPGKKNASIHLLSGGEKALTAIALVFSMFQLNPAPFCLLDEVDAPLDDANTERFCELVSKMSGQTQFLFISHNKLTMEMASQLVGVTMQEQGVSRVVAVDIDEALKMREPMAA